MTDLPAWPLEFRVRADRRSVRVAFDDGAAFDLTVRLLRAMTPSAEARGHGGPRFQPLAGTSPEVRLASVSSVGRYALRLGFDDGHASGLYDWARLRRIGEERAELEAELD